MTPDQRRGHEHQRDGECQRRALIALYSAFVDQRSRDRSRNGEQHRISGTAAQAEVVRNRKHAVAAAPERIGDLA
jgi:hypothetical protein